MADSDRPPQKRAHSESPSPTTRARKKVSMATTAQSNTSESSPALKNKPSTPSKELAENGPGGSGDLHLDLEKDEGFTDKQQDKANDLKEYGDIQAKKFSPEREVQQDNGVAGGESGVDELGGRGSDDPSDHLTSNTQRQPHWPERMIRNARLTDEELRIIDPEWWALPGPDEEWLRSVTGGTRADDSNDREADDIEDGATEKSCSDLGKEDGV